MDKMVIEGGKKLQGTVDICGAKNAALPILAATVLSKEKSVIRNIPLVADIYTMIKILKTMGAKVALDEINHTVEIDPSPINNPMLTYKFVSTMRGSICFLGPLLARFGDVKVSMPGGCVIGPRPIDLHLKGVRALGASVHLEHGYVHAKAPQLKGSRIFLGGAFGSSVLGTANIMMAACLAKGKTFIDNAACEPEVVDLGNYLLNMGAKIKGLGSPSLEIEGVKKLQGATHHVISDRIEAGTYILAGAISGGDITLKNTPVELLGALFDKLKESGITLQIKKNLLRVRRPRKTHPVSITTLPYPGFPTDLQAQMMAYLCTVPGISTVSEKIYPERFMHVSELSRMGASILLEGHTAIISGQKKLMGAPVMASDLRASAALVLAGLVAQGHTEVSRIYHLDRGYEKMVSKLQMLGAQIRREKDLR